MSIILGALGGAGAAMQDIGSTLMKSELDRDARVQDSNLALQRAKALEEFKQTMQAAPLNRLSVRAQQFAGEEVPQEAAPVTALKGAGAPVYEDGTQSAGLQGDPAALRKQIAQWPDGPDKTAALAQLDQQFQAEQDANASIVKGKTRKRTADEALAAAADDAKINDLPAYAEYESKIGKPKREEKRIEQKERMDEKRLDASERAAASRERQATEREDRRDARAAEAEDRRDARQQARIDAAEERRKQGGDVSREERLRYTSLFSDAGRRLSEAQRTLTTLLKDPVYSSDPANKDEITNLRESIKGYQQERSLYQSLLAGSQTGAPIVAPTPEPEPSSALKPWEKYGKPKK